MCILGDNEWCSRRSPCFTCAQAAHDQAHPELRDDCETCRLRSVQLSPAATPSKTRRVQQGVKGGNEWERGIVTDGRGMPLLDNGVPIGVKQYSEKRHQYESARRELANH